jgi:hypothetical protein
MFSNSPFFECCGLSLGRARENQFQSTQSVGCLCLRVCWYRIGGRPTVEKAKTTGQSERWWWELGVRIIRFSEDEMFRVADKGLGKWPHVHWWIVFSLSTPRSPFTAVDHWASLKILLSPSLLKATHTHVKKRPQLGKTHSGGWACFLLSLTGPRRIRILLWASRGGSSLCCCTHQHLQLAVRERKRRGRHRPTIPPFINRCCASRDPLDIHQSSGNDHWSGPTIEI